jgi:ATP-dependent DNA helicase RecG
MNLPELHQRIEKWEDLHTESLVLRASLADLDRYAFENYIQRAYHRPMEELGIGYEDLLRNLGYLREQDGRLHPTLACLLFFGRDPQRFYPHAHLVAARIPGVDFSAPPSDNKLIAGPAANMLEEAARFLRVHLKTAHHIHAFEPETYPELPEEAWREVLVNALAHRDYTLAAPVRVFIFDDRLEVRTPGSLPNTVTISAMRLGAVHVLRNPTIYTLFSRLGLVTGIGTGIYRAIQQVRELTQRELDLFLEGNEFVVALPKRQSD